MVATICPNENRDWDRLAVDQLSPMESRELTQHLSECPNCREKFEIICADKHWWSESSAMLRLIQRESGTFSTCLPKQAAFLHSDDHPPLTDDHPPRNRPSAVSSPMVIISGLQPTKEPGALGELGDYTIREIIGYGGMGTVLMAWDKRLSRVVAIKVLHPHLAASGTARVRFSREAKLVASISHPNVVPIHDVAENDSQPFIVMGYVPGGSLQDKLDADGPMPLEESLRIALQIAEGLDAAHSQGLVHRDIKPANVLLEARWQRVLITDFGLARALDDVSITASGHLAGTPQFMSPEQTRGDRVDHRSDLFSLGSVLYNMLTGRPPFRGETAMIILGQVNGVTARPVHEIQENLPLWANELIGLFHAKRPGDRVASAAEASQYIRACLQHVQNPSVSQLPKDLLIPTVAYQRRLARWLALIASVLCLAVAANRLDWLPILESRSFFAQTDFDSAETTSISTETAEPPPPDLGNEATVQSFDQNDVDTKTVEGVPAPLDPVDWNGSIDEDLDSIWLEISKLGNEPLP